MTTIPRPSGASASSIWSHLTGQGKQNGDYPHDAGDFGRCEAFLDANPDLRAEFPRMAEVNAYWAGLVPLWEEIRRAPDQRKTVIIRAVVKPIEKTDPSCGKIGPNATIRSGPITFKGQAAVPPAEPDQGMLQRAVNLVWAENNASTSFLQRRLGIGYNAAARLIERMEELAIVSKPNHVGKREVRSPDDLKATLDFKALITTIVGEDQAPGVIAAIVSDLRKKQKEESAMAGTGHNSADPYAVTADELRQFIERFEQLEAEKKDVLEQQKQLMAEAKGRGYDTKVMRKVIALRKRKPDEVAEEEAVLEIYKSALGMS